MDLNYLFYRQQIERYLADEAWSEVVRGIHAGLASEYEKAISRATGGRILFPLDLTRVESGH
jgi:hypothetical protein